MGPLPASFRGLLGLGGYGGQPRCGPRAWHLEPHPDVSNGVGAKAEGAQVLHSFQLEIGWPGEALARPLPRCRTGLSKLFYFLVLFWAGTLPVLSCAPVLYQ